MKLWIVLIAATVLILIPENSFDVYEEAKKVYDSSDFERAFPQFKRLAEKGDKRAQFYIGRMYHLGEGLGQDTQEAVKWYRMSADQGFAKAQNNLGYIYCERGELVEAISLFRKSLAQGVPQAQGNLEYALELAELTRKPRPARSTTTPSLQNMNDPSMEFHFHRMQEGLR